MKGRKGRQESTHIGKRMFIALILFDELTKATTAIAATEPQQYLQRRAKANKCA